MDRMKMETANNTLKNIEKLKELFPEVFTEAKDENGEIVTAVDAKKLEQLLSTKVIDGDESYDFTWVGKKQAIVEACKPIRKTLRPCREESVDWENTRNLYIEGDNLDVLKLLQESYLNKVKMIYIDPPYNTGNDFIYADDFRRDSEEWKEENYFYDEEGNHLVKNTDSNGRFHSDWCSMMYPRLKLARDLLTDDGVIFISINDKEVSSLKNIGIEIFGENNFVASLIWDKNHSAQAGIFKVYHEYILVFCKNIKYMKMPKSLNNDLFEAGAMKKVSGRHPASEFTFPAGTRFDAPDGTVIEGEYGETEKVVVTKGKLIAKNNVLAEDVTLKAGFTQANQMREFFYGKRENLVDSQGQRIVEFYLNSTGKVKVVKERGVESPQTTCHYGTQGAASNELASLFGLDECPFNSPKPIGMIEDFILHFVNDGDVVMDFFSGSATTAHAVMKANSEGRIKNVKFVLVQIAENLDESLSQAQKDAVRSLEVAIEYLNNIDKQHTICEIGKERIRRAGKKIVEETGKTDLDIGFRVLKLDSSNMKDVYYAPADYSQTMLEKMTSNIKDDRTPEDLLYACMLEWGIELSLPHKVENIAGFDVHIVKDGALIASFDAGVSEETVKQIADMKPVRAVFRDSGFATDAARVNVGEIFKLKSPHTAVKVI